MPAPTSPTTTLKTNGNLDTWNGTRLKKYLFIVLLEKILIWICYGQPGTKYISFNENVF